MSLFPDSNVVYAPKMGEKATFVLTGEIKRVQNPGADGNYKDKNKKCLGYYDLLPVDGDNELKMNTWRLYFALRDSGADVGDTIEIDHVGSGEYKVTKIV